MRFNLNWQGYNKSEFEAFGEIILQSIACLGILVVILIYIIVVHCNHLFTPKENRQIRSGTLGTIQSGSNTNTETNTKTRKREANKSKTIKYFNRFLVASLILSFIYIYMACVFNVIFVIILGFRWNNGCFIRNSVNIIFVFQRIVAYSFYILRLNVTFRGSVFELTKNNIRILIILIFITFSSSIIPNSAFTYLSDGFLCTGKYYDYYFYSLIWLNISDVSWCIMLSILYIKKLRQLIKNVQVNTSQIQSVVHKLSVLAFVTVISTLLFGIFAFVALIWSYQCVSLDLVINNICIMLSFVVFQKSYQRCCCCCIKIQYLCCIRPPKPEIELKPDPQPKPPKITCNAENNTELDPEYSTEL